MFNRAVSRHHPYGVSFERQEPSRHIARSCRVWLDEIQYDVRKWFRSLDYDVQYDFDWYHRDGNWWTFDFAFTNATDAMLFKLAWGGQ